MCYVIFLLNASPFSSKRSYNCFFLLCKHCYNSFRFVFSLLSNIILVSHLPIYLCFVNDRPFSWYAALLLEFFSEFSSFSFLHAYLMFYSLHSTHIVLPSFLLQINLFYFSFLSEKWNLSFVRFYVVQIFYLFSFSLYLTFFLLKTNVIRRAYFQFHLRTF